MEELSERWGKYFAELEPEERLKILQAAGNSGEETSFLTRLYEERYRDPKHPEDEALGPQECLSVREALDILTRSGAYQLRLEQRKGSLEPGKDADFCVLSTDPFTVPKEDLHRIEILETWTDGILRYHRA